MRVTVGVEAHTHEFIATAHEDQKFGFSLAERRRGRGGPPGRSRCASLELVGLHCHIGSQIFDTSGFEVRAHRVVGLAAAIRDEHGVELAELDLGGGLGIAYVSGDDPLTPREIGRAAARHRRPRVRRRLPRRPAALGRARARHRRAAARSRSTRSAP